MTVFHNFEASATSSQDDSVLQHMTKFQRGPSHTYTLITPDTPLHDLEQFLEKNEFAIGEYAVHEALRRHAQRP